VNPYVVPGLVLVVLVTVGIGAYGLRFARTTSDFLVASRSVSPRWNAAAISGEYLSAASFLGVAGLILRYGVDVLWYPVGFAAGYLALLLFVAAPLRRSGAFTLPDFCEVRLRSPALRRLATIFVIFIGCLYLVPQLQGAGLTFTTVTGGSYEWGALLIGLVVTANVALGGMRAITFVQAFQYWLKLTALAVPMIFLALQWQADGRPAVTPAVGATFPVTTTVEIRQDAVLNGTTEVSAGDQLTFQAGDPVPRVSTVDASFGADWLLPGGDGSLFATYSLILATFLGTMGLPHVLVRFYTNPDGAAARRTTLVVLGLVGVFYLLPTLYGVLGRIYTPELLMTGRTDAVVLLLPEAVLGDGRPGRLPVHLLGPAHQRGRRGVHRRAARRARRLGPRLPAGHRAGRDRPVGALPVGTEHGRVPRGRAGVRRGGVEFLPTPGVGHLVAGADRRRRGGGRAGRWRRGDGGRPRHRLRAAAERLARADRQSAGRLDRSAGVLGDGHRVPGDASPGAGRRQRHHAAPARSGVTPLLRTHTGPGRVL
jgi:hypothetical protein